MIGAVFLRQLRLLAQELGFLLAQVGDDGRPDHLHDRIDPASLAAQLAHLAQLGGALRTLGAGNDQLPVERRQRLVVEHDAAAVDHQLVLRPIGRDGALGLKQRLAQLLGALAQPLGRPRVGRPLGVEPVVDVQPRNLVGDQGRLGRIGRGVSDCDDVGITGLLDRQTAEQSVDRALDRSLRRERIGRLGLDRRMREAGRDQPGIRHPVRNGLDVLCHERLEALLGRSRDLCRGRLFHLGAQHRVEVRIVEQAERFDGIVRKRARAEELHLGRDHRGILRNLLDQSFGVQDARRARLDRDRRDGGVLRRQVVRQEGAGERGDRHRADDDRPTALEHLDQVSKPQPRLCAVGLGAISLVPFVLDAGWVMESCHRGFL